MQLVWRQLELFPDAVSSRSRLKMEDADRARRSGSQWLRAITSYLEFRTGDSWRRLSDRQQRESEDRLWYLNGLREIMPILAGREPAGISLVPVVADQAINRKTDDLRTAKLLKLPRVELAKRLLDLDPKYTNLKLLTHLPRPKLARMVIEASDRCSTEWRATA